MYEFDENNEEFAADESADEVLEQIEEGAEEVDEEASSVSDRAKERIDEANLWSLLISHTFFTEGSAKPEIIAAVSRKIKKFATKELEILLGMRSSEPVAAPVAAQFSEEEAQVLRMLIGKILKRDGPSAPPTPVKKPEIVQVAVKKEPALNAIGPKPSLKKAAPAPQAPVAKKKAASPAPKKEKKSFNTPNKGTKVKPMPSADVLLQQGVFTTPQISVTGDGKVSAKQMQQGQNLLGQVVQQLTGGHQIAVDNSLPADSANESGGDVNERF